MASSLVRKSWTDLSRRRARTVLAAATLAIAVASVGVFAVPPLMDDAMQREVRASRLADVTVATPPLELGARDLAALRRLPNVAAVQPRSFFAMRVYVGDRRAKAYLVGVPDFGRQVADVVSVRSGTAPGPGAVLTDVQNAQRDLLGVRAGDAIRAIAADGSVRGLRVSGEGYSLSAGQDVIGESAIVLYATPETVARLSGERGYRSLAFRLRDTSPAAVDRTIAVVRGRLRAIAPEFEGFADLPGVREPGTWPGQEEFDDFVTLFYIVTILALLAAVVLVGNTMTTLIAEQTREIGVLKAVGARRRQVGSVYARTAVLLGAFGIAAGVPLGILLANGLVGFFGTEFFAVDAGFGVDGGVVAASVLVGLVAPVVAALPAIRRAIRMPVREALETSATSQASAGGLGGALRRVRLPRTAQIGLRSAARRRRRSLATALIVAVAVGNLLAVMGLATAVTETTHAAWDDHGWQIWVGSSLRRPMDERAAGVIRATPGVAAAEPAVVNDVEVKDDDAFVWGVSARTLFGYDVADGRWYSPAEDAAGARVAVVERSLARTRGIDVGDRVRVTTGTRPVDVRVVGIASNQQENGTVVFLPLTTARRVLGAREGVNAYWVRTTSDDHALIDRTTTRVEDALTDRGYEVSTEVTYVGERDNVELNRTLTTSIAVLGFLVVAISMVGLVNAITMSVMERAREVGVLRCIGARGRDVRRIFAAEGIAVAVVGWLAGIPLGYVLDRLVIALVKSELDLEIAFAFPLGHVAVALAGTLVLATIAMAVPLRRAVRLRPGDALRYA